MADDPVIFNDGGSTRIKKSMRAPSVGEMDKLLDVKPDVGEPAQGRPGSQVTTEARNSSYGTINISFIDDRGFTFSAPGFPKAFETFQISSGNQQIDGDLVANGGLKNLRITVSGNNGNDPIVDAKQHNRKRRYIVSNASAIDHVRVNGELVFNANVPSPRGNDVVYTTVVVT